MSNKDEELKIKQSEELLLNYDNECSEDKRRCFIEGYFESEEEYEFFLKTI